MNKMDFKDLDTEFEDYAYAKIKETLNKILEYSPGKYSLYDEIQLRKDSDKIINLYDALPHSIKEKFPKGQVLAQYDFIKENIPINDSLIGSFLKF